MLPFEYRVMHAQELRHWWFRGRRRVLVNMLREVAGPRAGSLRILDYGCGTGGNTAAYSSLGDVVGIEPDATAIRLAQARGGARYCRTSGNRLPFRSAAFDVVVASDVLEHIDDDAGAVLEIARVLTIGGAVIITVPAHPWLFSQHDSALHHYRRYTKTALAEVLKPAGLRVRRLTYWNAALFPAISLCRLLVKPRPGQELRSDTSSSPWLVNQVLTALLAAEAAILRHISLPWGVSLVAVAERV